jgi:hypothetical protein
MKGFFGSKFFIVNYDLLMECRVGLHGCDVTVIWTSRDFIRQAYLVAIHPYSSLL